MVWHKATSREVPVLALCMHFRQPHFRPKHTSGWCAYEKETEVR